jgi:hypothetical protein
MKLTTKRIYKQPSKQVPINACHKLATNSLAN